MNIQWFPGHMTKALRELENDVKLCGAVVYVLDARAPLSCINPKFDKIISGKPCLYVLNKKDLADDAKTSLWLKYFSQKGAAVTLNAASGSEASKIGKAIGEVTYNINLKYRNKGVFRPVRVCVIGVPNCGKSTVINCLYGRRAAVTGDKPGVTKGKQWIKLDGGVELMDTPGTVWPRFDDMEEAVRLALIGSISDDVLDINELALSLVSTLKKSYPSHLAARYRLEEINLPPEILLSKIAVSRGFISKGGQADTERCSKAVLDDFRKGRLGKITLETP